MAFEKILWRNSSILTSPRRRIEGTACLLVHFTIGREGALGVAFSKNGTKTGRLHTIDYSFVYTNFVPHNGIW